MYLDCLIMFLLLAHQSKLSRNIYHIGSRNIKNDDILLPHMRSSSYPYPRFSVT